MMVYGVLFVWVLKTNVYLFEQNTILSTWELVFHTLLGELFTFNLNVNEKPFPPQVYECNKKIDMAGITVFQRYIVLTL